MSEDIEHHEHHDTRPSHQPTGPVMPFQKDERQLDRSMPSKMTGFFSNLSPKSAFVAGLIGGVMALCTIGFVILLSFMMRGGLDFGSLNTKPSGQVTGSAVPTTPPPSADTGNPQLGSVPPVTSRDHVRGDSNASVTLVEYSDYECPFCKNFHSTMQSLMSEYQGKVRWVYRHFPLSFHQNAQKEAEASECIAELAGNDAFWSYTDKIFERTTANGTGFALADLPGLAQEVGADRAKFEDCLNSGKYAAYVEENFTTGAAAGIEGTPGSFVIDSSGRSQIVSGAVPYNQLKAAIESAL